MEAIFCENRLLYELKPKISCKIGQSISVTADTAFKIGGLFELGVRKEELRTRTASALQQHSFDKANHRFAVSPIDGAQPAGGVQ